jgi:hypothetical protein
MVPVVYPAQGMPASRRNGRSRPTGGRGAVERVPAGRLHPITARRLVRRWPTAVVSGLARSVPGASKDSASLIDM